MATVPPTAPWLFDVDGTLIDAQAPHVVAAHSLEAELSAIFEAKSARRIVERFIDIFAALVAGHQGNDGGAEDAEHELSQLERRIREAQLLHASHPHARRFSREVLLSLAVEDCGMNLPNGESQFLIDHYWNAYSDAQQPVSGARELIQRLRDAGREVHLYTGSDARASEVEPGLFEYDAERSIMTKRTRIRKLSQRGIEVRSSFIADPWDKPSPEFFDMIFRELDVGARRERVVVVGDSFDSDLQEPIARGRAELAVLVSHDAGAAAVADPVLVVSTIDALADAVQDLPNARGEGV